MEGDTEDSIFQAEKSQEKEKRMYSKEEIEWYTMWK